MIDKTIKKSTLTSIGIDQRNNKLIDKLCKRYSLKKGEIVKLAFMYMDKACINPAEAPESTKAELLKINKGQDDIIRFIRNYEEKELNPMIRTSNSIAVRFDAVVKELNNLIASEIEQSKELQANVIKKIGETLTQHADVINHYGKQISNLSHIYQKDNNKLLKLIYYYSELATCGVMDGKKKQNLKEEIDRLINQTSK